MKFTRLVYRDRPGYRFGTRFSDFAVAFAALIAASPLLLIASLAIKIEDGGPIFFTQRRVGRFGRLFTIYKLRTMKMSDCRDALSPTSGRDSRITRVGAILRKTSVDELPQLFNVLRGDMALVGPRPEMPFIVRKYERWQHLRHLTKPGLTGLWQATCRSRIPLHKPEATLIDLDYVKSASHFTNIKIIAQTVHSLVAPRGAY